MQHQLDFWPALEKATHEQEQWENLSIEEQDKGIALLARLIAQALCPELSDPTQESSHEQ